jgi:anaphase-promoting complex subunit 2
MANAPKSFYTTFETLFRESLKRRDSGEDDSSVDDRYDENDESLLFRNLRTLGWIRSQGSLLHHQLCQAIQSVVLEKVQETISADFLTKDLYLAMLQWKEIVVQTWFGELLGYDKAVVKDWEDRLSMTVSRAFCFVRMDEIFDLVTEYPDSHGAVLELKRVLEITQMHKALAESLRSSLIRRLNHPGANTSQIIDVYIATIKVVRLIDPTDLLLHTVAEPVRTYLRGRKDTIRCIITSLTEADVGGDFLYEELRRQDAKPLEVTVDSDDEEEPPDLNWQPPPSLFKQRNAFLPVTGLSSSRAGDSDILAMLVSIYGSKELFVNEYRLMLADKLLAKLDYNTDKEVHTLELLKLRFGDMSMRNCQVMTKDIEDSKRANANIQSSIETNPPPLRADGSKPVVDAAMISHIFWPTLQNEPLKHHPRIQAELDEFSDVYAKLKNPRVLRWIGTLGTVQLELEAVEETEGGSSIVKTKEFTCSPVLATLISHFEDKSVWTAEALSNETGIPEHVVQKRMTYWISHHVVTLRAVRGKVEYMLASVQADSRQGLSPGASNRLAMMMMEDDDGDGQAVSATAQEEEEMSIYESYITVMLTNMQQASLDKIHNMLKMLVSGETKYNKTKQQLSSFLQLLCKQEKLECGPDGLYKLYKK